MCHVEALQHEAEGGRLLVWRRADYDIGGLAYRVVNQYECAIYDNYTTAADVRNFINTGGN
jgi:hypothetical protein